MGDHRPDWSASHAVTGYPVVVNGHYPPPQAGHYPPPQASYYSNPNRLSSLFRFLLAFLIVAASILFLMLIVTWAVIHPRYPEFRVTSLTLSNFNVSVADQKVSGHWVARFHVYNPNKALKLHYSDVAASVWYRRERVSVVSVAPFYQETKTSTDLTAEFSALNVYMEKLAAGSLGGDRGRGSIKFDLKLFADIRFKRGVFSPRRNSLRVMCDGVQLTSSGNSSDFAGEPKACTVYLLYKLSFNSKETRFC